MLASLGAAAAGMGAAVSLPWESEVEFGFAHDPTPLEHAGPIHCEHFSRTTACFASQGVKCEAWIYRPTPATCARAGLGDRLGSSGQMLLLLTARCRCWWWLRWWCHLGRQP